MSNVLRIILNFCCSILQKFLKFDIWNDNTKLPVSNFLDIIESSRLKKYSEIWNDNLKQKIYYFHMKDGKQKVVQRTKRNTNLTSKKSLMSCFN